MPEGAVYVGRPSKWGNPFRPGQVMYLTGPKAGQVATVADVVEMYRNRIVRMGGEDTLALIRTELGGRDLACYCPLDQPCHADVLIELSNPNALEGK
jgi:hypothetical protein